MTIRRRANIRRKTWNSKQYVRSILMEDTTIQGRQRQSQQSDKMAGELMHLMLRFLTVQNPDWLTAKLDEAKTQISSGREASALETLDEVKTNAEKLKAIRIESQKLIEKQQARLQAKRTRKRTRKHSLACCFEDIDVENEKFPLGVQCQGTSSIDKDDGSDMDSQQMDVLQNHEESDVDSRQMNVLQNHDGSDEDSQQMNVLQKHALDTQNKRLTQSRRSYKIGESTNSSTFRANDTRETSTTEVLYQRDRASTNNTNHEMETLSADSEQAITYFSRTENGLPVATDESSRLFQRLRDIIEKIRTRLRNFERDKILLQQKAERERKISEREINLSWQRSFMELLGIFLHIDIHGNDQRQAVLASIKQFGVVMEY